MKQFRALTLAMLALVGAASTSEAASITYNLGCTFTGFETAGVCTPGASVGTITLADNLTDANWIDVTVDLSLPGTFSLTKVYLSLPATWDLAGGTKIGGVEYEWSGVSVGSLTVKSNDTGPQNQPNGSCSGSLCQTYRYFDLEFQPTVAGDPFTGTLKLRQKNAPQDWFNLNPDTFPLTNDPQNGTPVFAGVQYQLNTQPSFTWVAAGALPVVTPEPASLALLGAGLGLVAMRLRRRA